MDVLSFIARYEAILKERKIPKMTFYKDCKITDAAVSQWRKNKNKPAMTTITRIAEYLKVTPEYLLTGDETKKEPASISESEPFPGYLELSDENRAKAIDYIEMLLECQHRQ